MRVLRSTLIIELAYHEAKSVKIKRFPTESEIEELEFSRHKMVDDVMSTYGNEILVRMYNRRSQSFVKRISGGLWDFNELIPEGVDIDIRMKHADSRLNGDIGKIARKLSIRHLKKPTVLQSRYSTHCQIDKCELEDKTIELFLKDFSDELGKSVKLYKITKEETKIEKIKPVPQEDWLSDKEKQSSTVKVACFDCGNELEYSKMEGWYDQDLKKTVYFCQECWNKRQQGKTPDKHKKDVKEQKQTQLSEIREQKQLPEIQTDISKKQSFWKRLKNRLKGNDNLKEMEVRKSPEKPIEKEKTIEDCCIDCGKKLDGRYLEVRDSNYKMKHVCIDCYDERVTGKKKKRQIK